MATEEGWVDIGEVAAHLQVPKDSICRRMDTKDFLSLALLWLVTMTQSVFSQEIPILTPIVPLEDQYRYAVPVGGTPLRGVAIILEGRPVSTRLTVRLPETEKSRLCIALASRDGRYVGRAEYAIDGTSPGVYGLLLESEQYSTQLALYLQEDLAVLAWLPPQSSCEATEMRDSLITPEMHSPLIVLSPIWGATPLKGPVTILSNPENAISVRVSYESSDSFDSESQSTATSCVLSSEGNAIAYGAACTVETQDGQGYDVAIMRYRFQNQLRSLRFRIEAP